MDEKEGAEEDIWGHDERVLWETGENCILNILMIFVFHQMLFRRLSHTVRRESA